MRPSSIHRSIECPGSEILAKDLESGSEFASEGTAAHKLAEVCLRTGLDPDDFLDDNLEVEGETFLVTREMSDAVRVYTDYVRSLGDIYVGEPEIRFEAKLRSETLDLEGTCDSLVVSESGNLAHISDLKYGAGVFVSANGNQQLRAYALLVSENYPTIEAVKADIVQPRKGEEPIRSTFLKREELEEFRTEIQVAKRRIAEAETVSEDPEFLGYLQTGDHCQFCPARDNCPKIGAENLEILEDLETVPKDLDSDRLLYIYERKSQISNWIKSIESEVKTRLENGDPVGDFKLVQAYGNRRWNIDEAEVEKKLRRKKFKKSEITETRLLSPAKLEKIVGKELVSEFAYRPEKGLTIVPGSDPREAYSRQDPSDVFPKLED